MPDSATNSAAFCFGAPLGRTRWTRSEPPVRATVTSSEDDRHDLAGRRRAVHPAEPAVEDLDRSAPEGGVRAGLRVATANEVVDLLGGLRPVDRPLGVLAEALVGGLGVVLLDAGSLARLHQPHRFRQRVDPHVEQLAEVERAEGVVGLDLDLLLEQDGAGVDALVGPEDREARPGLALDDGPVHRAGAAVLRQQRGVVLDRLQRRREEDALGEDVGDEGHHVEVGGEGLVGLEDLVALEVAGAEDGDAPLLGRGAQRVGPAALGRRRRGDGDDLLAVVEQAFEDGLAEGGLADDRESHRAAPKEGVGRAPS